MKLRTADIAKYALTLMDVLFTDEEMGGSSFMPSLKSNKPALDQERVDLLEGTGPVIIKFKHVFVPVHGTR